MWILVPQPGIEPGATAGKSLSPNPWTARELPAAFALLCELAGSPASFLKIGVPGTLSGPPPMQTEGHKHLSSRNSKRTDLGRAPWLLPVLWEEQKG